MGLATPGETEGGLGHSGNGSHSAGVPVASGSGSRIWEGRGLYERTPRSARTPPPTPVRELSELRIERGGGSPAITLHTLPVSGRAGTPLSWPLCTLSL